jgi:peptide/nickel transport system substrate-binding protein
MGAVAVAATASMVLAGCTTSGSTTPTSTAGSTVTIAQVNEATSFNYNTPQGNLDTNGLIWQMTQPQFFTLDQSYNIVHNKDIGSYEKTSDDPLTVKYTLNKGLKWSDGKPMTADDLMLGWAQASGYYESATLDEEGNATKGVQYFASAAGFPWSSEIPKVDADNLSITIKYTKPYVDWELVNPIQFPAHVVAKQAGVSEADLMKAIKDTPQGNVDNPGPANETLKKAASFINTGYDATAMPKNKDVLVSGGPLVVTGWTPKQSMTFAKNADYTGSHSVKFDKLVMRFIGDANAQVTALQNGEVDAIQPQASADTIASLKKIKGANVIQGNQAAYDHLDLNFKSAVFSDPTVREAFLLTIPREQILKAIVSQIWLPDQKQYKAAVKQNGSSAYDKVDIAKATSLLAGKTPSVKILYNTNNPNRVNAFQAIQASAKQAGFNVTDGGSPDWSTLLTGGDYDASIFGWINPGAGNAQLPQLFQIGNSGNYSNFNNQEASDLAVQSQSTLDPSKLDEIKLKIDTLAFQNTYGLPLFQLPGVFASSSKLQGVKWFGGQNGITWNVWDWSKK